MRLSGAISPDKSVHIDIRTGKGKITSPTAIEQLDSWLEEGLDLTLGPGCK